MNTKQKVKELITSLRPRQIESLEGESYDNALVDVLELLEKEEFEDEDI